MNVPLHSDIAMLLRELTTPVTAELQAATTITAAETVIGSEIDCSQYNTLTIWVDYTKGDETSYDIIPKYLRVTSGDEHPFGVWSTGAIKAWTAEKFRLTASAKVYIVLNVHGIDIVKIYGDATGGTPTGTAQVGYSLTFS